MPGRSSRRCGSPSVSTRSGPRPSIGTVADSFDNALAETTNGLYKTECVRGPDAPAVWDDVDELELATLVMGALVQRAAAPRPLPRRAPQQSSNQRSTLTIRPPQPGLETQTPEPPSDPGRFNWRLHLPRTLPQLRHDALIELINRGATVGPNGQPIERTINRVIDDTTFEHTTSPNSPAPPPEPLDPTDPNRFSRTLDGTYINPAELVARSLIDHVRRVVTNAAGTTIDLGRRSRLFTGNARDAALLTELTCYWTGCWVPTAACQIDHLLPWEHNGQTNPGNGAPACGTHNRTKQHGFHTWKDPTGTWHITRPDGTPAPDHLTHWPDITRPDDNGWTAAA